MNYAAPRGKAAEGTQREAHTERRCRDGEEGQEDGEVCEEKCTADAGVGHGVDVGDSQGSSGSDRWESVSSGAGAAGRRTGAVAAGGHGDHSSMSGRISPGRP